MPDNTASLEASRERQDPGLALETSTGENNRLFVGSPQSDPLCDLTHPDSHERVPTSELNKIDDEIKALANDARSPNSRDAEAEAVARIVQFLTRDNSLIELAAYKALRSIPGIHDVLADLIERDTESASPALILAMSYLLNRDRGADCKATPNLERHKERFCRKLVEIIGRSETASPTRPAALKALGYLDLPKVVDLFEGFLTETKSSTDALDEAVFEAAALSEDQALHVRLLDWFVGSEEQIEIDQIPFSLSRLVNGRWISKHLQNPACQKLAYRFGYIDQELFNFYSTDKDAQREDLRPADRKQLAVSLLLEEIGIATITLVDQLLSVLQESHSDLIIDWKSRQSDWMQMFLPEEVIALRPIRPVSIADTAEGRVDRDLFFGALRQADWPNAEDKRDTNPFGYEYKEKHGGRFFYLSSANFKGNFNKIIKLAEQTFGADSEVKQVLLPFYVADSFAQQTETRKEQRKEQIARFLARWRALAGLLKIDNGELALKPDVAKRVSLEAEIPGQLLSVPVRAEKDVASFISAIAARRTVWKYALLDPSAMEWANLFVLKLSADPDWNGLSFGARSALKLLAYDLLRDTRRKKQDIWPEWESKVKEIAAEERGVLGDASSSDHRSTRRLIPSLGIELQSLNVPPEEVYLWKNFLPFFDIPSPERLRYGRIVETAFRPAWSATAFLVAIPILHRMGLLGGKSYKRSAAFHISLSGDLGAEARWIAFPLLMFSREKAADDEALGIEERAARSAWVLSKGFIHLNNQNDRADPQSERPLFHTEIRTARLSNVEKGRDELNPDYQKFLPAVQYLGAALAAWRRSRHADPSVELTAQTNSGAHISQAEATLADIWQNYQSALSALVCEIPQARDLLDTDWYESTGDPKDTHLTATLKIFKLMGELYEYKKSNLDNYSAFSERVKTLFLEYAKRAQEAALGARASHCSGS
jgi:hypothetical protein